MVENIDQHRGVIRLMSGTFFDLLNPKIEDIHIGDIAWSLAKQIRYNGHVLYDYSVARHSIIMSYYVHPKFALEALLHDAGEAYISDIVQPLKCLLPDIEEIEDRITALIMKKFNVPSVDDSEFYVKSPEVAEADNTIYLHECYYFGRPGGKYNVRMHLANIIAKKQAGLKPCHLSGNRSDMEAFGRIFQKLSGIDLCLCDDIPTHDTIGKL